MLELAPDVPALIHAHLAYDTAADALLDPRGRLVRFTRQRWTVMHDLPDGGAVFCKFRRGRRGDAVREWRALVSLADHGLPVPQPVFFAEQDGHSAVGIVGVSGRPMDALLAENEGAAALRQMAGILRRMHGVGWVYRDMYWNHVFADGRDGLSLIDVERAFCPRWRFDRWVVKDLAGLLSSIPAAGSVSRVACLRFLRDYAGGLGSGWKDRARRVIAKAERIRRHVTKYPG